MHAACDLRSSRFCANHSVILIIGAGVVKHWLSSVLISFPLTSRSASSSPSSPSVLAVGTMIGAGEKPDFNMVTCQEKVMASRLTCKTDLARKLTCTTITAPVAKQGKRQKEHEPGRCDTICGRARTGACTGCAVGFVPIQARFTTNFVPFLHVVDISST